MAVLQNHGKTALSSNPVVSSLTVPTGAKPDRA